MSDSLSESTNEDFGLFDGKSPKLISGELRVKDADRFIAEVKT
jgi:hypothetical protein